METMTLTWDDVRTQSQEVILAKLNRKSIKHINSLKLDNASWAPPTVKNPLRYQLF
jgi:hypothetical protein